MSIEAMKQALEALKANDLPLNAENVAEWERKTDKAIISLRQAIAEAEKQEPVAWPSTPDQISDFIGGSYVWREHKTSDVEPHEDDKYCLTAHDLLEAFSNWIDTHPQLKREPLTDEQIAEISVECATVTPSDIYFARAIEAAHGIKENT